MLSHHPAEYDCGDGKGFIRQRNRTTAQVQSTMETTTQPRILGLHEALSLALKYQNTGHLEQAEAIYRKVLSTAPNQPEALHLLGLVEAHRGRCDEALGLIRKAIAIRPEYAEAQSNLGNLLKTQNLLEEAVAAYYEAIAVKPNFAEAYYNLGGALRQLGRLDEAVDAYHSALEITPNVAAIHNNLANVLRERGDSNDALTAYRRALDLKPDYVEALSNLGALLVDRGDLTEAVFLCQQALSLRPGHAEAHNNLGNAYIALGQYENSGQAFLAATHYDPGFAEAWNNLGSALREQGRLTDAVAAFRRAIAISPHFAAAHNNLGNALRSVGRLGEASTALLRALALKPDLAQAHNNLANIYKDQARLPEAIAAFRRAVELDPSLTRAHGNLAFCMIYDPTTTAAEIFHESRSWASRFDGLARTGHQNDPEPERRLRIGYVSPDFRRHSVAYFLEPLMQAHRREVVEIFCYAEVARPDEVTDRLKALSDHWCDTCGRDDATVAGIVEADGVDILVDLAGHTADNRLAVFARKPAPVQVSWLGYPATIGLTAIDYRLTDALADPPGESDHVHSEKLVRLPHGFHCYLPPAEMPSVGPLPAQSTGQVTYGSFNTLAKLTPQVVATWAQVLQRVPGSRLLIKNKSLADTETRRHLLDLFGREGIGGAQLELLPFVAKTGGHLAIYNQVDIALDSFPYNGTTTSCEAMWMGVPFVSLSGDRHAGRVGASLLRSIGLDRLLARTADDYIELAIELADDLDALAALRAGLRSRMRASPLCDAKAFALAMEAAYRDFWRVWCEEHSNETFGMT